MSLYQSCTSNSSGMTHHSSRFVLFLKIFDLLHRKFHVDSSCSTSMGILHISRYCHLPMMSCIFSRLVVPTIGADTPGETIIGSSTHVNVKDHPPSFVKTHAIAIWAIVTPFFASSSTLISMSASLLFLAQNQHTG